MPSIRVERGANLPGTTRGQVAPGQIFSVYEKGGALGRSRYAHLGNNGKFYSVNLGSRELASTKNGKSKVALVGKFTYDVKLLAGKGKQSARQNVREGEIFTAGDEPGAMYLHMARKANGEYLSVNLVTGNIASTANGRGNVTVVGTGTIKAEVV